MKKRLLAATLVLCMLLTSCTSKKKGEYLDTSVKNHIVAEIIDNKAYIADGFYDTVCVMSSNSVSDSSDYSISAKAGLLFNISDNEVLYGKNIYDRMYPASTTKVLSAYCALKYGKLYGIDFSKEIVVSDCVNNMVPGAMLSGFLPGDTITLEEAMNCMLLESGNDSALIVAEAIAGSVEEFVELMNYEAKRLGATGSNFLNPHGLFEEQHYSTAYDLYLIFNEAIKYPEFVEYIEKDRYSFEYTTASGVVREKVVLPTNYYKRGKTSAPDGVHVYGGKTGYEDLAGRCLVLLSSNTTGDKFISVILYAEDTEQLYNSMNTLLSKEQ